VNGLNQTWKMPGLIASLMHRISSWCSNMWFSRWTWSFFWGSSSACRSIAWINLWTAKSISAIDKSFPSIYCAQKVSTYLSMYDRSSLRVYFLLKTCFLGYFELLTFSFYFELTSESSKDIDIVKLFSLTRIISFWSLFIDSSSASSLSVFSTIFKFF